MLAPRRSVLAAAAVAVAAVASAATPALAAKAPRTVNGRVSATFVMHGRITAAVRVAGEHRGRRVTRTWTFTGQRCAGAVCRRLLLTRERSAGQYDHLVLTRRGTGRYAGNGRFSAPLQCRGTVYPRGEVVPYRVTVDVTHDVWVQGTRFASALRATYTNRRRIDHTICPLGPSHDAAVYTGRASPAPSPPTAAFTAAVTPGTDTAAFTGTFGVGGDQAPVTAVAWRFGDPASGPANTANTPQATHVFSAAGAYTVAFTVTDAQGRTATQSQVVTVPGPAPPPPA